MRKYKHRPILGETTASRPPEQPANSLTEEARGSREDLQGKVNRLLLPKHRDPYGTFRLEEDINHYPSMHPDTPWNSHKSVSAFYSARRQEIRISTPGHRHDPVIYQIEDFPMYEWRQVADHDHHPLPLELKRDASGMHGRWLPIER